MFNELSYELADVRTALKFLEKRVDTVERLALAESASRADSLASTVVDERKEVQLDSFVPSAQSAQSAPVLLRAFTSTEAFIQSPTVVAKFESNSLIDDEPEILSEESNAAQEGLEVYVGRNLNKLGISFLVIGCALALVYQFQYFTPVLKIISGLIGGALLIWGGEKFEKNNAKMAWYGRALIGGGWALSYFSVFAAHHFASVRIIESAAADFALLFAVASAAIYHSLKYKSQTITGITLTLAFATICLSPATSFSVLACTLLVAALVGLCSKMNWFNLFVYGECVFYAVYLGFILPQIMRGQNAFFGMNSADGNFFTGIACSVFCWMAMNVVIFTSKELTVGDRNRLVLASLINCGAFVPTVLVLMANSHEDMKFGFLLASGIAYLISTLTASRTVTSGPLSCNRILGLSLVTMAVPEKLTGDWMSVFLSLEVPVLVWAGLKYEMPSVRVFAGILVCLAASSTAAAVLFPVITSLNSLLAAVIAFTAYGVTAALYEEHRSKCDVKDRLAFHFYYALCAGVAMATLGSSLTRTWITPGVVLGSMLTVFLGMKLSDKTLRIAGEVALFFGLPVFVMVMHVPGRSVTICLTILGLLYLAAERRKVEGNNLMAQVAYQGAAASMFAVLTAQWFSFFTLESLFALESLAILIYGFIKRDLSIKIVALLASAFLALKFVIVDITSIASMDLFGQTVSMPWLYGLVCTATLLTTAMMYLSSRLRSYSGDDAVVGFYAHFVLTAMVVATLNLSQVPTHWLSLALTVQGVFVLTLGFKYRLKGLRVSGLFLLGLVIARLLFVELVCVSTIYRIMSFIAAGVVLLVASLAYAKMSNETVISKS